MKTILSSRSMFDHRFAPRRNQRRGITLLFVISLIVLFLLMGTSFVLLSRQYRNSAVADSRIRTRLDDSSSLVQRMLYDILREPDHNNVESPFRGHSVLGDQYGFGVRTRIYGARMLNDILTGNLDAQGQILAFSLDSDGNLLNDDQAVRILDNVTINLSSNSGEYESQVLTFVSGPLSGTSLRILAYQVAEPPVPPPSPGDPFNRVFLVVPSSAGLSVGVSNQTVPPTNNMVGQIAASSLNGSEVIINGRDYGGTGVGIFVGNESQLPGSLARGLDRARLVSPNSVANTLPPSVRLQNNVIAAFGPDEPAASTRMNFRNVSPAWLPNRMGETEAEFHSRYLSRTGVVLVPGAPPTLEPTLTLNHSATNEDHDALTEQDMFLSGEWTENWPVLHNNNHALGPKVIPSFYRPELVRYFNMLDDASNYPPPTPPPPGGVQSMSLDLAFDNDGRRRRDHFLPNLRNPDGSPYYVDMVDSHSQYAGTATVPGNVPALQAIPLAGRGDGVPDNGWDVDNDGDGIRDSIWMPSGLPLVTDVKGRKLMPLVAVHIVDMGGRLNANVHGNLTQREVQADRFKTAAAFWGGGTPVSHGQGYAPSEIMWTSNLTTLGASSGLMGGPGFDALANPAEVTALMRGANVGGVNILGRYGADLIPGIAGRDAAASYRHFTWPSRIFTSSGLIGNGYSSAIDAHGRIGWGTPAFTLTAALQLDPYDTTAVPPTISLAMGIPSIDMTASALTTEVVNAAIESDFSRAPFSASVSSADTPFSPRELEALLRRNDSDSAAMAPRLRQLLAASFGNSDINLHKTLTTESMEVPAPPESLVDRLRRALSEYNPAAFGQWPQTPLSTPPSIIQNTNVIRAVQMMLPPEVVQGRKMDLNFVLGNGLDDNGNGIVDEPQESYFVPPLAIEKRPDPYGRDISLDFDHDANATNDPEHLLARQTMARHLYTVILLSTQYIDRNGDGQVDAMNDWFDYNGSTGPADVADLLDYRRDVAQWAANVIEFRDPDAISSGYEFDLDPWDGWGLDGRVETNTDTSGAGLFPAEATADRFVVWGAERPELLLTETLVAHDVRTTDTTADPTGELAASEPATPPDEQDMDSQLVPNASCFIELYNPWYRGNVAATTGNTDVFPAEYYGASGVDLRRTDVVSGDSPVWRIVASGWNENAAREVDLRTVYFVRPGLPALRVPDRVFFPDAGLAIPELNAGGYAVVGSSGVIDPGNADLHTTYLGRRNTPTWDTELANTRSITLDTGTSEVSIRWWDDANATWQTSRRRNIVTVPVSQVEDGTAGGLARPFGLTDPAIGYEAVALSQNPLAVVQAVADGFHLIDSSTNLPLTLDRPLDKDANEATTPTDWSDMHDINGTHLDSGLRDHGLRLQARRIRLERLANPLLPWNPEVGQPSHDPVLAVNPYLVVDVLGADVAVFNGVSTDTEPDTVSMPPPAGQFLRKLYSFERSTNNAASGFRNVWLADPRGRQNPLATIPELGAVPVSSMFANTDDHFISENLFDSLGEPDIAHRNLPVPPPVPAPSGNETFNWLTWNNRPFVSHLELASVPHGETPPIRSGDTIGTVVTGNLLLNSVDVYRTATAAPPGNSSWFGRTNNGSLGSRFSHLPDLYADIYSLNIPAQDQFAKTPGLHRILDFVEVPSRYVGTDYDLNPVVFADTWNDMAPDGSGSDIGFRDFRYNPPYNTVSRFRNPGKVNLNTVFSQKVWAGVMGDYAVEAGFVSLAQSRRDQNLLNHVSVTPLPPPPPVGAQALLLPTPMPFMFRSSLHANYVSELYVHPAMTANNIYGLDQDSLVQRSGQTGLFRAVNPASPDLPAGSNPPMFDYVTLAPHADPNRSAYFRNDQRQRLGNLTTNRSSVFAIWITIGFFEVGEDGNPIAIEGAPRQRGFYLIDRSIPVAFEPGENHNVDRVILSSSIIE